MRNSTTYGFAALAGSVLLAAGPVCAGPVITGTQVLSTAGSAAGGAVGGPVGGLVGGLLGRQIGKAFQKKPPQLENVQTPVAPGPVQPVQAEKPLEVKTVDTARRMIPTPSPAASEQASNQAAAPPAPAAAGTQPAADVSAGARPASGTLDAQLASLQRSGGAPAAQ